MHIPQELKLKRNIICIDWKALNPKYTSVLRERETKIQQNFVRLENSTFQTSA